LFTNGSAKGSCRIQISAWLGYDIRHENSPRYCDECHIRQIKARWRFTLIPSRFDQLIVAGEALDLTFANIAVGRQRTSNLFDQPYWPLISA
jgi:hypothetical protein